MPRFFYVQDVRYVPRGRKPVGTNWLLLRCKSLRHARLGTNQITLSRGHTNWKKREDCLSPVARSAKVEFHSAQLVWPRGDRYPNKCALPKCGFCAHLISFERFSLKLLRQLSVPIPPNQIMRTSINIVIESAGHQRCIPIG